MTASRPLFLFLIGIFFSSIVFSPFILDFTLTPRVIAIALVLLATFWLLGKEKLKVTFNFILAPFLLYLMLSWASGLWSNTRSEAIFENSKLSIYFLVFLFSVHFFCFNKETFLIALCKICIVLFLFELTMAIYQMLHLPSFEKGSLYTVYGMNSHKNLFSSFIILQLPFLILCLKRLNGGWKTFSILNILLIYLALLALLQTKAVWIGCGVGLVTFFLIYLYKKVKFVFDLKISIIVLVILANLFFIFVLPYIIKRGIDFNTSQIKNQSVQQKRELDQERLALWDKTYSMFREHPLLGVGAGNWQIYFPNATLKDLWRAEDLNYTFQRPHNDMLWMLSETGLLGFNLFIVFICSLWLSFVHVIKINSFSKEENFELLLFASVIPAFFTAAFFDFPKERIEHLVWLGIILGFCFHTVCKHLPPLSSREFTLKPLYNYAAIILCAFILICGIYRYLGEYHTRKMYDNKVNNNLHGVISEGNKSLSFVYQIDPTSLPIKWYTGNAFALQNAFDLSQRDFLDAIKANPYNRNVLNDLASSYAKTSNEDLALKYYKESSRISPRFDDPKLNMAAIYIQKKNYKAADSCLKTLFHDSERRSNYQKLVNAFLSDQNH